MTGFAGTAPRGRPVEQRERVGPGSPPSSRSSHNSKAGNQSREHDLQRHRTAPSKKCSSSTNIDSPASTWTPRRHGAASRQTEQRRVRRRPLRPGEAVAQNLASASSLSDLPRGCAAPSPSSAGDATIASPERRLARGRSGVSTTPGTYATASGAEEQRRASPGGCSCQAEGAARVYDGLTSSWLLRLAFAGRDD